MRGQGLQSPQEVNLIDLLLDMHRLMLITLYTCMKTKLYLVEMFILVDEQKRLGYFSSFRGFWL